MAQMNVNLLASLFTGTIGDELTIYERGGKLIIAKKRSASKKKPSAKQVAARKRMKAAVNYAKYAMEDPDLRKKYQGMAEAGQNAFNMAVQAYFSGETAEKKLAKVVRRRRVYSGDRDSSSPSRQPLHGPMMVMNFSTYKRGDG